MPENTIVYDLCVIGGGINGVGVARDAAGRGLKVLLCEQSDLASSTSSASTKLFHGGLRYLEYYEFGLVRKALKEREVLWANMPHIAKPMRFILPHHRGMRPFWLLRLGLFLYDHIGGRKRLRATELIDLAKSPFGKPLKQSLGRAFEYSDCWVDDSRLVALNARDAAIRGATIQTQTRVESAAVVDGLWQVQTRSTQGSAQVYAKALVNAAGPFVRDVIDSIKVKKSKNSVRLVRGSHIVVAKLFDHDRCYFFQGADGRIIFAIPFEGKFTLIGTTDADHQGSPQSARCSEIEAQYLCDVANEYFEQSIRRDDIVWSFAGVRPLFDDGAKSAAAATRDYVLEYSESPAPLLHVFGGKLTTYRCLAEEVLEAFEDVFTIDARPWTENAPLPGGDFGVDGFAALLEQLKTKYPFVAAAHMYRLARAYGSDVNTIFGTATTLGELGENFGGGLSERECRWLVEHEFARSAEDILWRRSKLGLHLSAVEQDRLAMWVKAFFNA